MVEESKKVSKKILIGSIVLTIICLALGVTCAIIRKFDLLSAILLGVVVVFGIVISITVWKEAVDQKNDAKNAAESKPEEQTK